MRPPTPPDYVERYFDEMPIVWITPTALYNRYDDDDNDDNDGGGSWRAGGGDGDDVVANCLDHPDCTI